MKLIKTFEEACISVGTTVEEFEKGFELIPEKYKKHFEDHGKVVIITEAINDGWKPDWSDTNQPKYQLWPDVEESKSKPSGFGLSFGGYGYWVAGTYCGSRLCFCSRDAARHFFDTFTELYENYMLM